MRPLFFLFKSEKKTNEGHLKQMREGLRNIFFYLALELPFLAWITNNTAEFRNQLKLIQLAFLQQIWP